MQGNLTTSHFDTQRPHLAVVQAPDVQETVVADVNELMQGCREQLQALAPTALANADLMGSLLINGWLQRFCLM